MTPDSAEPEPVELAPAEVYRPDPVESDEFSHLAAGPSPLSPRPDEPQTHWRVWLAVGAGLQVLALVLWYIYAFRD
jgi:hypothetical protein